MTIFLGRKDEQLFTRQTDRQYEYVVIVRGSKKNHDESPEIWTAKTWCSRLDLARTKCRALQKDHHQVEILPVFPKTRAEVKALNDEILAQKRAREEALALYQAEQEAQETQETQITGTLEALTQKAAEVAATTAPGELVKFEDFQEVRDQISAENAQARQNIRAQIEAMALEAQVEEEALADLKRVIDTEEAQAQAEQPEKMGGVPYDPSLICKACGRILTGPESIARGYGDKCWRRVWRFVRGREEPAQAQHTEQAAVTNQDTARAARYEIKRRIKHSPETCICGKPAGDGELWTYDHQGGYMLPGYSKNQWVYTQCPRCGHQNSLRKMKTVTIEDIETEGRREAGIRFAAEEAAKAAKKAEQRAQEWEATKATINLAVSILDDVPGPEGKPQETRGQIGSTDRAI